MDGEQKLPSNSSWFNSLQTSLLLSHVWRLSRETDSLYQKLPEWHYSAKRVEPSGFTGCDVEQGSGAVVFQQKLPGLTSLFLLDICLNGINFNHTFLTKRFDGTRI